MLLNVYEAAEELSIAPISVRRLIRAEAIPHRRIGSKILFLPEDIQEYIESAKRPIRHPETKPEAVSV